jgi:hypothetical protein
MQSMDPDASRTEVLAAAVPAKPGFRWLWVPRHAALECCPTHPHCSAVGSGRRHLLAPRTHDRAAIGRCPIARNNDC